MGAPRGTVRDRFMAKVVVPVDRESCWLWTGALSQSGYGRFTVSTDKRGQSAPSVAYELFVGEIPVGLTIDHLCRNRACVNPFHLEAVTQGENVMRSPHSASGRNVRKTHCPQNHPYDSIKNGCRRCSICDGATEQRRNQRRRERRAAA